MQFAMFYQVCTFEGICIAFSCWNVSYTFWVFSIILAEYLGVRSPPILGVLGYSNLQVLTGTCDSHSLSATESMTEE